MITAHAHDPDTGVAVEVGPGGALHDLTLDARSLRLGGAGLARAILTLVDTAASRANARVAGALGDVGALGLRAEPEAEDTTPTTWRV
ncbi:YbaB/EbfC family DNA-binding protein [Actinosynnema sp. NPDC020468]|uniref:YbaB/EbfC family DNA-binding protein n=1 Tax=Actinosynnema sp. NPDC020468 TaxID=3154488 RepID=UPI0033BFDD86